MISFSKIIGILCLMVITAVMTKNWNRPKDYRNLLKENYRDSVMIATLKRMNNDTTAYAP